LVGCSEDTPCDPGYIHVTSSCVPLPPEAAPPKVEVVADAAVTEAAAPVAIPSSAYGDLCTVNEDCKGSINYCINDLANPPYCTKKCDPAAPMCPDKWSCFNAEIFIPGAGQICAKPR
jgi:hypothetical protein